MSYFKNIILPFTSALVGGAAVVAAIHISPALRPTGAENPDRRPVRFADSREVRPERHDIADHDMTLDEMMERSLREMHDMAEPHMDVPDASLAIDQREDDKFVYFDIKVDDVNSTLVHTRIENGYVNVSGSTQKKSQSDSEESVYQSTFNKTFPVPDNVDSGKMEMIPDHDKYILKFPKLKA